MCYRRKRRPDCTDAQQSFVLCLRAFLIYSSINIVAYRQVVRPFPRVRQFAHSHETGYIDHCWESCRRTLFYDTCSKRAVEHGRCHCRWFRKLNLIQPCFLCYFHAWPQTGTGRLNKFDKCANTGESTRNYALFLFYRSYPKLDDSKRCEAKKWGESTQWSVTKARNCINRSNNCSIFTSLTST